MGEAIIDISEVQIHPVKPQGGLVAFASFVLNNQFYIGSIALYTSPSSEEGFRLVYPSRLLGNGTRLPLVHPINREAGFAVQKIIVKEYEILMEKLMKDNPADDYEPTA